jgi:hypothetical protein
MNGLTLACLCLMQDYAGQKLAYQVQAYPVRAALVR